MMLGFSGREREFYYELNEFILSGLHNHVKVDDFRLNGCINIKTKDLRITGSKSLTVSTFNNPLTFL
jgi:hypothetical protein